MGVKFDFGGWATKNNLLCSDGRTIEKDAFKHNNGKKVPLVWNHIHNTNREILGHAILENRDEGVYSYCYLNNTEAGQNAKEFIRHGDIDALSIFAGNLKQQGSHVIHGEIREVSMVLAGANPGAFIDQVSFAHSDDFTDEDAIIYTGEPLDLGDFITHSEDEQPEGDSEAKEESEAENESENSNSEEATQESEPQLDESLNGNELEHAEAENVTIDKEVFNSMTDEQKTVCYAMIGQAIEDTKAEFEKKGENDMSHNAFENNENNVSENEMYLSHSDMETILKEGKRCGSLRDAISRFAEDNQLDSDSLAHSIIDDDGNTINYGMANMKYLFPDAKRVPDDIEMIKRQDEWVSKVISGVHRSPFSHVKSIFADITMEDARAKGYIKGNIKVEEVIKLLKRTTDATTVYKKQKIDRDDMIDITDFNVISFLWREMRMMLNEELARAILVGDGRSVASNDKIDELKIRPIWKDDALYAINTVIEKEDDETPDAFAKKTIKAIRRARKNYKGSGNLTFFTTEDFLEDCLEIEDLNGRVIYDTEEKLRSALRVKEIITVPVMENQEREVSGVTRNLVGILVNLNDYNVGTNKGGEISTFQQFDIDYNQEKLLIEGRCSGALVKPYSAIVVESLGE